MEKQMVNDLYQYVVRLARRYAGIFDPSDLIQEGLLVLLQTVRKSKLEDKKALIFYCKACIRHRMIDLYRRRAGEREKFLPIEEATMCSISSEREQIYRDIINRCFERADRRKRNFLAYLYIGCDVREVMKLMKISRASYYRQLAEVRELAGSVMLKTWG